MKKYDLERYLNLLVIPFVIVFLFAAFFRKWAGSELWSSAVPLEYLHELKYYDIWLKPLFHGLLYLNSLLSTAIGVHPIETSRAIFAIFAICSLFFIYKIVLKLTKNRGAAYVTSLLILTNTTFISNGFTVRSDVLAMTFFLFALMQILQGPRGYFGWSVVLPLMAMLASTPKSIFLLVSLAFFVRKEVFKKKPLQNVIFLVILVALIILSWATWDQAILYFLNSFSPTSYAPAYFEFARWSFVFNFLSQNLGVSILLLLSFFHYLSARNEFSSLERSFCRAMFLLLVVMFLYPNKPPFFVAVYSMVATLPIGLMIHKLGLLNRRLFRYGIVFYVVVTPLSHLHEVFLVGNNRVQRVSIKKLNHFFSKIEGARIFDPSGLLFQVPSHKWYIGPFQEDRNFLTFLNIEQHRINVILTTNKIQYFGRALPALEHRFLMAQNGIASRPVVMKEKSQLSDWQRQFEDFEAVITPGLSVQHSQERILSGRHLWPMRTLLSVTETALFRGRGSLRVIPSFKVGLPRSLYRVFDSDL